MKKADEKYTLELDRRDLITAWNLTDSANSQGGAAADALAGLRSKLLPLVEKVSKKK